MYSKSIFKDTLSFGFILLTTACLTSADVIISGDVSPGPNDYTIGTTSEGSITVNNGSVVSDWNVLQIGAGALGTVTVTDSGTSITAVRFDLGNGSEGRFNLLNGAVANVGTLQAGMSANGFGAVTIDGSETRLTTSSPALIGNIGPATLSIRNGGLFDSSHNVMIGWNASGATVLSGENSKLITTQSLRVGASSLGELEISAGAVAESHTGMIGHAAGAQGSVIVAGAGSRWSLGQNLGVGMMGDGDLTIEGGGTVETIGSTLVAFQGGQGNLVVRGEGSSLITGGLRVGQSNQAGHLTVDERAIVTAGAVQLVNTPDALFTGESLVTADTLTIAEGSHLRINSDAILQLNALQGLTLEGSLTFESGLIEMNDSYFVGTFVQNGTFTWNGGTLANATHFQDCPPIIQQGGTFHVGPIGGAGDVGMKVDYELRSGATLAIELASEIPWQNDQFVLYGAGATLAGNLDLSVLNEYVPEYGHQHVVVEMGEFATYLTGIFSSISGVEFMPDRYLAVVYDQDSIDVIAALPGDANLDQSVDFNDLLAVAQNYESGNISTWIQGDFNGSGSVDFNDLLLIAQHYGSSVALNSEIVFDDSIAASFQADWQNALVSVPEPSGALVFGAMTLFALRRSEK